MAEPTCLMRSSSHPCSGSREFKEGDPLRALTESISFGRFMSESLAWEKWSIFSHNRYLEEVEQFSKPGSVAQKKAYFEAYYKKRAAMKAAALLEQANATINSVPETETSYPEIETSEKPHRDSLPVEATDENPVYKQENQLLEPPCSSDSNGENDNLHNAITEGAEEVIDEKIQVENLIQEEYSKQLDNAKNCDKIAATAEEELPNQEAAEKENVVLPTNNAALPSNKRQMNSSSKSTQIRASKILKASTKISSSTQLKIGTDLNLKPKNSIGDLIKEKRPAPKSIHMSINLACCSCETSKAPVRASKECSTTPANPAKASIYRIPKLLPSVNCQSEDRRTRLLLNKSVAGSPLQALYGDSHTKSSASNGSKARSLIITSPFSFRSEDRAAKRKEFFQKLEEKKEVDKTHMHVKSKIPLTRPRSPNSEENPLPMWFRK